MPLSPEMIQSVAEANYKAMAELGVQDTLTHRNRINVLAETALGKILGDLTTTDVPEGLGLAAAQRGDLSKQISDLAAAVASVQAYIKAAGNVPPVTP